MSVEPSREVRDGVRRLRRAWARRGARGGAGAHLGTHRGAGLEFRDVRESEPGDDARFIDWNVSARRGRWHSKTFEEERDRRLVFVLDLSRSTESFLGCPPARRTWLDTVGLLGGAATDFGDRVGLYAFGAGEDRWLPPQHGREGLRRMMEFVASAVASTASLPASLERAARRIGGGGLLVVGSDFRGGAYESALGRLGGRHRCLALRVTADPELADRRREIIVAEDPEGGPAQEWDFADARHRAAWRAVIEREHAQFRDRCRRRGVVPVQQLCGHSPVARWLEHFEAAARGSA